MSELTQADLASLKGVLEARADDLRAQIREEYERTGADASGLLQELDRLDDDAATLSADDELNLAMLSRDIEEMRDIAAALDRIANGTYGDCIDCGEPIRPARLRAFPTAKRCIACQSRFERARGESGRGRTL